MACPACAEKSVLQTVCWRWQCIVTSEELQLFVRLHCLFCMSCTILALQDLRQPPNDSSQRHTGKKRSANKKPVSSEGCKMHAAFAGHDQNLQGTLSAAYLLVTTLQHVLHC